MLKVVVHRDIGPQRIDDATALIGATLTLEQFTAFLTDRDNVASVRLDVSTSFAREQFNSWLDELAARHPLPLAARD